MYINESYFYAVIFSYKKKCHISENNNFLYTNTYLSICNLATYKYANFDK